jgi:hypothetical protein
MAQDNASPRGDGKIIEIFYAPPVQIIFVFVVWLFNSLDAFWRNALFGDPEGDSDMEAEEDDDPSDPEGFTQEALNAKQVVLCLSKSIVSLVSSVGTFTALHLYCIGSVFSIIKFYRRFSSLS